MNKFNLRVHQLEDVLDRLEEFPEILAMTYRDLVIFLVGQGLKQKEAEILGARIRLFLNGGITADDLRSHSPEMGKLLLRISKF